MGNKFKINSDIEAVTAKFIDEFFRVHPQGDLPVWFKKKTSHQTLDKGDSWQVSIVASKNHQRTADSNVVIDEVSGEKKYVIADSYEEIILFSMKFKKPDLTGEVIADTDLAQIDGDELVNLS